MLEQAFYNALSRKDVSELCISSRSLGDCRRAVVLDVAQAWLREMSKLKLRDGSRAISSINGRAKARVSLSALAKSAKSRPAYHEDAVISWNFRPTRIGCSNRPSSRCLLPFMDASTAYVSVAGWRFALPGYMVWLALAYAASDPLEAEVGARCRTRRRRYAREADLRFALVRSTSGRGHCLYVAKQTKGLSEPRVRSGPLMMRRPSAESRVLLGHAGYGWVAIVAPLSWPPAISPQYVTRGLMMRSSLQPGAAALRCLLIIYHDRRLRHALRVASFRLAFSRWTNSARDGHRVVPTDDDRLVFDQSASLRRAAELSEKHVMINAGERV